MPYIDPDSRVHVDHPDIGPWDAGTLNYRITRLCNAYLGVRPSYEDINEVIGVLECAKLELYRRVAAPYEDKALARNGDVYTIRP